MFPETFDGSLCSSAAGPTYCLNRLFLSVHTTGTPIGRMVHATVCWFLGQVRLEMDKPADLQQRGSLLLYLECKVNNSDSVDVTGDVLTSPQFCNSPIYPQKAHRAEQSTHRLHTT